MEVSEGQSFVLADLQYLKIAEQRISCCSAINATLSNDAATKIQVLPLQEVQVEIND
jgi:hypothetical protein